MKDSTCAFWVPFLLCFEARLGIRSFALHSFAQKSDLDRISLVALYKKVTIANHSLTKSDVSVLRFFYSNTARSQWIKFSVEFLNFAIEYLCEIEKVRETVLSVCRGPRSNLLSYCNFFSSYFENFCLNLSFWKVQKHLTIFKTMLYLKKNTYVSLIMFLI